MADNRLIQKILATAVNPTVINTMNIETSKEVDTNSFIKEIIGKLCSIIYGLSSNLATESSGCRYKSLTIIIYNIYAPGTNIIAKLIIDDEYIGYIDIFNILYIKNHSYDIEQLQKIKQKIKQQQQQIILFDDDNEWANRTLKFIKKEFHNEI